jgi:hypothetical protein
VVFGLLYVNGPLAASENGSEQTALQDGSACDYDPRAEKARPTLLTGTSNKDRETMRDISAGRRDTSWCRVFPIDFIACSPPANARLEFCNQMRRASCGLDDRILSSPRGRHKLLVRIAAELGWVLGG